MLGFLRQPNLQEAFTSMTETEYQHPLMAAYWKQLDTRFPQVETVFDDVMAEALAVLTREGIDAYLEAGRVIGKLGRGVEPMLAFLEEWPSTAKAVGEAALPVVMALKQDNERYLERVAKVQWGLMICVYCISHAPAILQIGSPEVGERGPLLLAYFLLVLYIADLAEVITSAVLGGTPLKSDPNKTLAGVMVAATVAGLLGTALWWMTPYRWWQSTLMSLIVAGSGFLGSVVLSSVKKSLGARDWDTGIVGVRAVLDRLDALAFAAPVFFHLTAWLYSR